MTNDDRYILRQQEFWRNCRRIHANRVLCRECYETDPRCFLGDQSGERRIGDLLIGLCERCRRKGLAPTAQAELDKQWQALKAKGAFNKRCYCGEDNPFCFETDHLDWRKTSDFVFGCCINCHLKRTSRQLTEYCPDNFSPRHKHTQLLRRVRGTREYLELVADALKPIEEFLQSLAIESTDSRQE